MPSLAALRHASMPGMRGDLKQEGEENHAEGGGRKGTENQCNHEKTQRRKDLKGKRGTKISMRGNRVTKSGDELFSVVSLYFLGVLASLRDISSVFHRAFV